MKKYIKFIIRYRFFLIGFLSLITLLSCVALSKVKISGSMAELALGDSPNYARYLDRGKEFGSDQFIIIAFEDTSLFSKHSIDRLKSVVRKISDLPEVKKVQSILDQQDIRVIDGMPRVDFYVDLAAKQPDRSEELLEKLRADPFISGLWISKDGRHSMVVIELLFDEKRSDQELPPLIGKILDIFVDAGFDRSNLHQAGQIPILVETVHQALFNLMRLFGAGDAHVSLLFSSPSTFFLTEIRDHATHMNASCCQRGSH